ncbi:Abi family protein [Shewanella sp. GutDb-MelDb]|uniref:Abi family protein n=1 Tax=Shewanella sp. GutDb-MelDb TaxID=2058316 RepID=UPI0015E10BBF|nr:Abi family protein [Shewanella sp. GutDb-MelDb]
MTIQSIIQSISQERIATYKNSHFNNDEIECVGGYLWNKLLCSNLLPPLQLIEVSLRNALYYGYIDSEVQRLVNEGKKIEEAKALVDILWFKTEIEKNTSPAESKRHIETAERQLVKQNKPITADNLISKLPLGFWISFCSTAYDVNQTTNLQLWPTLRSIVFPNAIKEDKTPLSIKKIRDKLVYINSIRNRLAHHEPMWNDKEHYSIENAVNKTARIYADCLTVINWINSSNLKLIKLLENDTKYATLCVIGEIERFKQLPKEMDKLEDLNAEEWLESVELDSRHNGIVIFKHEAKNFSLVKSSKDKNVFYLPARLYPKNQSIKKGDLVNFEPVANKHDKSKPKLKSLCLGHI